MSCLYVAINKCRSDEARNGVFCSRRWFSSIQVDYSIWIMDDEVAAAEHWTDGRDDVVVVLAVFLACKIVGLLYARIYAERGTLYIDLV